MPKHTTVATLIVFTTLLLQLNSCQSDCYKCYGASVTGIFVSGTDTIVRNTFGINGYYDSARYYRSKGYTADSIVDANQFYKDICNREDINAFRRADPTYSCQ
jgi:hypothetical protein